ncbi:MAG: protein BatD [Alphaproteobacteria bacterium]|nr:protein BatD [Alphaproteobacteria bacterium]
MKKIIYVLLGLSLFLGRSAFAEQLQATVNRTEIPQGETFLLTLETDNDKVSGSPDLSVLDKNFTVYSVGNAFQSTYINGVSKHSRQWQIVLMPKNAGQIEIPAIKLDNLKSEPIQLNVISSQLVQQGKQQSSAADGPKFAVNAEVDNKNPFVQQQINYTFSIYDSGGLYGEQPVIVDNGNRDWIVKSMGEPTIESKVINGQHLREIQFHYALFPQKSGLLQTPDLEFQGYYLTKSRRGADAFDDVFNHGFFNMGFSDMFATRNPIVLRPESIDIDVRAIPAQNSGYWWLPASKVILSAEWEDKNPTLRVGEAVSRSVYLKAAGVVENQLPDIKFAEIDGVKQYPEKPVAMSSQHQGEVISIKKFGNVYIPEKSGEITLPEITVDWYNIHTGQIEHATLPAQTLKVLPSTKGQEAENRQAMKPRLQPDNKKADLPSLPTTEKTTGSFPVWVWTVGAFVLGVVLSYLMFGRKKTPNMTEGDYRQQVEKAAKTNNLKELRDSLIAWARQNYPDEKIHNLDDLGKKSNSKAFKQELSNLSKALYSGKEEGFNQTQFLKVFKEEQNVQKKSKKQTSPLPKLYK